MSAAESASTDTVLLRVEDGVAWITLNRPDRLNAFAGDMRDRLHDAIDAAATSPDVRVMVLTGAGRGFCTGADVEVMGDLLRRGDDATFEGLVRAGMRVVRRLHTVEQPVIAAVNGPAAGAGAALAAACDFRIASERASIGFTFIAVIAVGLFWIGPKFMSFGNISIMGTFLIVPVIVGVAVAAVAMDALSRPVWPLRKAPASQAPAVRGEERLHLGAVEGRQHVAARVHPLVGDIELFARTVNAAPDGHNINRGCGSTHPEGLLQVGVFVAAYLTLVGSCIAALAWRGMSGALASAGSCTMVIPPHVLIAASPATPVTCAPNTRNRSGGSGRATCAACSAPRSRASALKSCVTAAPSTAPTRSSPSCAAGGRC